MASNNCFDFSDSGIKLMEHVILMENFTEISCRLDSYSVVPFELPSAVYQWSYSIPGLFPTLRHKDDRSKALFILGILPGRGSA